LKAAGGAAVCADVRKGSGLPEAASVMKLMATAETARRRLVFTVVPSVSLWPPDGAAMTGGSALNAAKQRIEMRQNSDLSLTDAEKAALQPPFPKPSRWGSR